MSEIKRRPLGRTRLQQLASEARLPVKANLPPAVDDDTQLTFLAAIHPKEAKDLLLWRRTWDVEYKGRFLGSNSKDPLFDYDEVNRAVRAAVNENSSPGLVEALLNLSKEKKSKLWDKMKVGEQKPAWSDIILVAIRNRDYDMTRLLASRTDKQALDSVLPSAIYSLDMVATRILLERGANLADYHGEFMSVMAGDNEDMAELLINGPRPPCFRCRSEALIVAVGKGSLHLSSLLVQRGADVDFQTWGALRVAIQSRRPDITLAIVSGPRPPRQSSLDGAMWLLYSLWSADLEFTTMLCEVLLCAGAKGDGTSRVLTEAAKMRHADLVDMIIGYGSSVDGAALLHAIETRDKLILTRLLRGKPSAETLSRVLQLAEGNVIQDPLHTREIFQLFGARLRCEVVVNNFFRNFLIQYCHGMANGTEPVIQLRYLDAVRTMLDGSYIDINFDSGAFFRIAVSNKCQELLLMLLAKSPNDSTLGIAASEAVSIHPSSSERLIMVKLLVDSGAKGPVIDRALVAAVGRGPDAHDEIEILLSVASIDYDHGAALKAAIGQKDLAQLDRLLTTDPNSTTLGFVWESASRIEDATHQYAVYKRLLEVDASAAPLGHELVAAITKGEKGLPFCELMLAFGAEVGFNDGQPLITAIKMSNSTALRLLLGKQPSQSSLRNATESALALSGDVRIDCLRLLLDKGLAQATRDGALLAAVSESTHDIELVKLMLEFGSSPEIKEGEAFTKAVLKRDSHLLSTLLSHTLDPANLSNALSTLLQTHSWQTDVGITLLRSLISHGATSSKIDHAFVQCCADFNLEACQILIDRVNSSEPMHEALRTVIMRNLVWQSPDGLELTRTLLSHGASGRVLNSAFVQAVAAFNIKAVLLIQSYVTDSKILNFALREATLANSNWLEDNRLAVLEMLLDGGARMNLEILLTHAVLASKCGKEGDRAIDFMLQHHTSVNNNGGQVLSLAVGFGNVAITAKFCRQGPSAESLTRAFFMALRAPLQHLPVQVLGCMKHLIECTPNLLNLNYAPDGIDLPLIQCLTNYPNSPELARLLIDAGADIESKAVCPLLLASPDNWHSTSERQSADLVTAGLGLFESVPALLWSLMQLRSETGDSVAETLIELGADVNYVTPHLRLTALILAARYNRPRLIEKLLRHGADSAVEDTFGLTALSYASRHGYTTCVETLLRQPRNFKDGSLHEASRNLHFDAVGLLLDAGYDPNLASAAHGGRTPLGELCLLGDGNAQADVLARMFQVLAVGGADPFKRSRGLLPVFLALANNNPERMVRKLCEQLMHNRVFDPRVVLEKDGIAYSPTMLMKKLVLPYSSHESGAKNPAATANRVVPYPEVENLGEDLIQRVSRAFHLQTMSRDHELLRLLEDLGAIDRFYYTGTQFCQPKDMVGAPEEITLRFQHNFSQVRGKGDELHFWGDCDTATKLEDEKRNVEDRRALSRIVDSHIQQQHKFKCEAERFRLSTWSRQQLDHKSLETKWMANYRVARLQPGTVDGDDTGMQKDDVSLEEDRARREVAAAKQAWLIERERAIASLFPSEDEKRVVNLKAV